MKNAVVFFLILLCSCSASLMDAKELNEYILDEANGCRKVINEGPYTIITTYRPSDFIARQQMEGDSQKEYDSLRSFYGNYFYFIVDVTYEGKDLETRFALEPNSFADKIAMLSSGLSQNIKLESGGEYQSPVDYMYSRSYGTGSSQFMIAFNKIDTENANLIINGQPIGFGKISIPFSTNQLFEIPKLKL
jgi:hypothetical protein